MAIKIYSDKTRQYYDTVEQAEDAEFKMKEEENRKKILVEREAERKKEEKEKAAAERKIMAGEIEEARQAMIKAQKAYKEKIEAFVKKYGSYHYTSKNIDDVPSLFDDFFTRFF